MIIVVLTVHSVFSQIVFEGKYNGGNLFFQNPQRDNHLSCVDSIYINGERYIGDYLSNAFELRLDSLKFHVNDSVRIEIFHASDCSPKLLNIHPNVQFSSDQFIDSAHVEDGTLVWISKKEGELTFEIQQFKWNKWVILGSIESIAPSADMLFDLFNDLHKGVNIFRIKILLNGGMCTYSSRITYFSQMDDVNYELEKKNRWIIFSRTTAYELFNSQGQLLIKDADNSIDLKDLPKGKYYLNYANRIDKFRL